MLDKFNAWIENVEQLNQEADMIKSTRDECYEWMANKIKDVFRRSNNPVPMIHFKSDASEIICCWDNLDVIVPVTLIMDLHMSFSFDKRLTTDGAWKKVLIFYPFK